MTSMRPLNPKMTKKMKMMRAIKGSFSRTAM